MLKSRQLLLWLIFLCQGIFFTGCDSPLWDRSPPPSPTAAGVLVGVAGGAAIGAIAGSVPMGAAIGAVWGGSIGGAIESRQSIIDYLLYNGVQVVIVGDDVQIILASDKIFYRNSANLNPNYYGVLNALVEFLSGLDKISVKVAGYTDNCGSWQRNLALSQLQARVIENYLWTGEGLLT